ncbi:uncharacterized protein MONBRDRAFT_8183 [Monosiga brevicollis MX1]|uniref:PID domain-containing protein n=1 Tax=Monosiga brevicollis TaxID=81824 RepID=A9UZA6_MONBE|nr:uncharacterized protein MONBRDRAFT_8183 [Monosiga brevicollis MX1]EDQ89334.1 predicted protein [Monosiga brevicollis MX1]|eukprot:XP_001745910.1 hypothetical protein [Monosiga brevicollis MX1]
MAEQMIEFYDAPADLQEGDFDQEDLYAEFPDDTVTPTRTPEPPSAAPPRAQGMEDPPIPLSATVPLFRHPPSASLLSPPPPPFAPPFALSWSHRLSDDNPEYVPSASSVSGRVAAAQNKFVSSAPAKKAQPKKTAAPARQPTQRVRPAQSAQTAPEKENPGRAFGNYLGTVPVRNSKGDAVVLRAFDANQTKRAKLAKTGHPAAKGQPALVQITTKVFQIALKGANQALKRCPVQEVRFVSVLNGAEGRDVVAIITPAPKSDWFECHFVDVPGGHGLQLFSAMQTNFERFRKQGTASTPSPTPAAARDSPSTRTAPPAWLRDAKSTGSSNTTVSTSQ